MQQRNPRIVKGGLWNALMRGEDEEEQCMVHKWDKVMDIVMCPFPNERRDLFYLVMSFSFAGDWASFKTQLEAYVRKVFEYRPYGADGAGRAAADHRAAVGRRFCTLPTEQLPQKELRAQYVRQQLLNGRWKR